MRQVNNRIFTKYSFFPACPTLLDGDLLTEMSTDSQSVFLGQKWWCQSEALQGDVWPLWAPAGWSWLLSKPAWVRNGMYFSFLEKVAWSVLYSDTSPCKVYPSYRSSQQVLLGFRWSSWGKKKRIFPEHEGSIDKWKEVGQRIQIHTIQIISRGIFIACTVLPIAIGMGKDFSVSVGIFNAGRSYTDFPRDVVVSKQILITCPSAQLIYLGMEDVWDVLIQISPEGKWSSIRALMERVL